MTTFFPLCVDRLAGIARRPSVTLRVSAVVCQPAANFGSIFAGVTVTSWSCKCQEPFRRRYPFSDIEGTRRRRDIPVKKRQSRPISPQFSRCLLSQNYHICFIVQLHLMGSFFFFIFLYNWNGINFFWYASTQLQ